jgi:hypothetical protein
MLKRILLLTLLSILFSTIVSLVTVYVAAIRPRQRSWGVDPAESTKPLPGDEIIPEPTVVDTRGITIAAAPERIWPWLLQMGYGRAGWYSYDRLDNESVSVRGILPEFQHLEVGDVVPTHPGGGFRVESIEPDHHLVLKVDPTLMTPPKPEHADGAADADVVEAGDEVPETPAVPASLEATGRLSDLAMGEFEATWAFVLEPIDDGHTRLIERFRVQTPPSVGVQKVAMPILGLGVFAMTRKQLLGIRERAEDQERSAEPLPSAA